MKYALSVLLIGVFFFTGRISYTITQGQCQDVIKLNISGLPPSLPAILVRQAKEKSDSPCGSGAESESVTIAASFTTDAAGNASFEITHYARGTYIYQVQAIGDSLVLADIVFTTSAPSVATPVPAQPTIAPAPVQTNFCPGAAASRMAIGMVGKIPNNPLPTALKIRPTGSAITFRSLKVDAQVLVIGGPRCVENATWWQVDFRFRLSDGRISQSLGWVREHNGSYYLVEPTGQTQAISYLPLVNNKPQAEGLTTVINVLVRTNPLIPSSGDNSIAKIKQGKVYDVLGKNGNGLWIQIRLENGQTGWICEHLTRNNIQNFSMPVLDTSSHDCKAGT